MLRALLIDPFQKRIHEIEVGEHVTDWYKWCDCDCFDVAYCGAHFGQRQDIWVDDNGMNRYPMYPCFKWKGRHDPLVGYGLLMATTPHGDSISTLMPISYAFEHVEWEKWEGRLNPPDFFEQLSRLYYFKGDSR